MDSLAWITVLDGQSGLDYCTGWTVWLGLLYWMDSLAWITVLDGQSGLDYCTGWTVWLGLLYWMDSLAWITVLDGQSGLDYCTGWTVWLGLLLLSVEKKNPRKLRIIILCYMLRLIFLSVFFTTGPIPLSHYLAE